MTWLTRLLIVLAPLALAGCITEGPTTLPMALGPADAAQAACLTYGETPAFDGCEAVHADTAQ